MRNSKDVCGSEEKEEGEEENKKKKVDEEDKKKEEDNNYYYFIELGACVKLWDSKKKYEGEKSWLHWERKVGFRENLAVNGTKEKRFIKRETERKKLRYVRKAWLSFA